MAKLTNTQAKALLEKYEPILYFDSENKVLPMDTEVYVPHCSLWETPSGTVSLRQPKMIAERGKLSREDLAKYPSPEDSIHYLVFAEIDEATEAAMKKQKITVTTGFRINKALEQYAALSAKDRTPTYHGRVFYSGDYLVLQYWFFYPINDFKTSHNGVNDHEGDWEGISLFFPKDGDGAQPAAVDVTEQWAPLALLAAAHEGASAKNWDDIKREGDHPIFYIARGSHATYYDPGRHHVVDMADGKGAKVGPGTANPWRRIHFPISGPPAWATEFDGAWGYYTRDALGGFNGPGGLLQTIQFSMLGGWHWEPRTTWTDPVGEAGLD
ncbi:MAG: hypothetical protein AAF629_11370 [Chloroflexota bacterium]